jgi:MFS family permease
LRNEATSLLGKERAENGVLPNRQCRANSGDREVGVSRTEAGPGAASLLSNSNFWPFFLGNLMSNSGTWFQSIAQVLLVYRLTGSPFLVGVVNFSQFAAVLFLAPVAGSAADRFDRRLLVVITQVSAATLAGVLALLTFVGRPSAGVVIAIALGLGVCTALTTPALQAMVPGLVTRSELPTAIALIAVTFNLARAIGPVLGVLVIAQWGMSAAFTVNALSYLVLVVAIFSVRPLVEQSPPQGRTRLRDSARMVRADRGLLVPIIVVGITSLAMDPVNTLSPAFATEVFGRPDTFAGFMVGAFGTGAVIAAFVVAGRWAPSRGLLTVSVGLIGAGMGLFALSTSEIPALIALAVGGFGYLSSVTTATSLLHLNVDDEHRGRVMAMWSLSFHGSRPIGSLVDGAIAGMAGIQAAGLVMVIPALTGCAVLTARLRRSRNDARLRGSEETPSAGEGFVPMEIRKEEEK